jgi:rRNA maturation RNase YbeY
MALSFKEELHRVMVHGILHLIGFNDATDEEKMVMRQQENYCLSLLSEII